MPDLFLSYAHVDKHWVDNFAPLLEQRVNQYAGCTKPDRLWKDNRLTGNQTFSPEIHQQLNSAKCLIACFSVGYFASNWCMRELTEFSRRVGADSGRIFCLELDELVIRQRPPLANKMLGYRFWRIDGMSKRSYPLYPTEVAYDTELIDLSKDIAAVLREEEKREAVQNIPESVAIAQEAITQIGPSTKQIAIEHTTARPDLQDRQQRLQTLISRLQEQYDYETRVEEQIRIQKVIEEKQFSLNQLEREMLLQKYK